MFCPRCHREYPEPFRYCPYDGQPTGEKPAIDQIRVSNTRITDALLGDRYRVRGFIGKGAMARVYLAEDEETGRAVAVKVLDQEKASRDPHARERLHREAEAVTLVGHPNIVQIFEVGERDDGADYLVMEFLYGESVLKVLRRETTLPVDIALPALRQASSALWAAHQKGVIHRDVKPANLYLVGEPGDPYDLKVLDFGLSRLQTSELTAAGQVLGTPGYMAPEQVVGEPLDARTDVYGLGMVMYAMFTGRHPFPVHDEVEMVAHQVHTSPPPPRQFAPELDPRIEAVVRTAVRKQPSHRYQGMDVLFEDLGKVSDPQAELFASQARGEDRYEPEGELARLVADSLREAL